jgi:copper(I)-binding protein
VLVAASVQAGECPKLDVTDAWVRLAPPGSRVLAGYARLSNPGSSPVTLFDTSGADFERVELHSMSFEDGVMRMRRLDDVEIAPGETLELAPGGKHLMLIGPKRGFVVGDKLAIDLEACDGMPPQRVELEVRAD